MRKRQENKRFKFIYLIIALIVIIYGASFNFLPGDEPSLIIHDVKAATVSWDGGGAADDWCTDANWSNDAEPTSSDDVTIDTAVTVTTSGCVTEGHTLNFSTLAVGGTAAAVLEIQANIGTGGSITIGNLGTITQKNATTQTITGTLAINSGGTLNHTDNTTEASTAPSYAVNISAATITINSGGSINVDGKGNTAGILRTNGNGTAPGLGSTSNDASGAGHGGDGGNSGDPLAGGTAYCDVTGPATIGSGGGSGGSGGSLGGDGGGLVVLNATGTITINGTITADGANGATQYTDDGGGGAGGGVKITADTIAGTPTSFTMTGGNAGATGGGAGGGGCVYLGYTTANSVLSTAITMNGGTTGNQLGGAGIVYIKQTGTSGDLYLTNGGTAGAASTQNLSSLTVATITLKSEAEYRVSSGKTFILNSTGNDPMNGGDGTGVLRIDDSAVFTPNATFSITGATLEKHQSATMNNATTLTIGSNGTLDMRDYTTSLALSTTTLTVNSGGIITHGDNTTEASNAPSHIVNISAATITINSGGSINVDGKGNTGGIYRAVGNGTGGGIYGSSDDGAGGAHGGNGGNDAQGDAGGTAYCTSTNPVTIGSGGAGGYTVSGGDGAGLVKFNVTGTLTIAGTVSANGANGTNSGSTWGGAGAGGGVNLTGGSVVFSGIINATGGNSSSGAGVGGGGGGGCVYIAYQSSYNNTGSSYSVSGGTGANSGGVGVFTTSQTNQVPITTTPASISQSTDDTGKITFSTTISDTNSDNTKLKVEYSENGGTNWYDPDLVSVTPSSGSVDIDDAQTYQIGTVNPIDTSTGSITLTIVWDTQSASNGNGSLNNTDQTDIKVRVTPNDSIADGEAQSSANFEVDNSNPISAGNLTVSARATDSITYTLGAAGSDANINNYKIYYKQAASGVAETDTLHTTIATASYTAGNTTQIGTISANTQYVANIWTYDAYGNKANATEIAAYTSAAQVTVPLVSDATTKTTYTVQVQWTYASGTPIGVKVEQDTGCDGYETSVYDNATTLPSVPYSVSGLTANTCYKFRISSYNSAGNLNTTSIPETAQITTPAAQPQSLTSTSNDTASIVWDWADVTSATDYKVYRSSDDALIGSVGGATSNFTQTVQTQGGAALVANTQYTVYVRAVNANGTGIASSAASAYTSVNVPTNLGHTNQTATAMRWTWQSGGSQKDYYARTTNPTGNITDWTTNTYWDQSNLTANNQVILYVKARNEALVETPEASYSAYTSQNAPTSVTKSASTTVSLTVTAAGTFPNLTSSNSGLYFENTTNSNNSGWTQTNSWLNSGLSANTAYTIQAKARNGDGDETTAASASLYTAQNAPTGISKSAQAADSITLTADGSLNNLTSNTSGLYFENTTNSTNSGWIQANSWNSGSLSANTQYVFQVKARNGDSVETTAVTANYYTAQSTPLAVTASSTAYTEIVATATGSFVNLTTGYAGLYFENVTFGTNSGWIQVNSWASGGLASGNSYQFRVKARNSEGTETSFSGLSTLTTQSSSAEPPPPPLPVVYQCQDGTDNDADGLIDMNDADCVNAQDNDESGAAKYQCNDNFDNDADGKTDYPNDIGCSSATDNTESGEATYQCNDTIDNDADGKIDLADKGCANETDNNEADDPVLAPVLSEPKDGAIINNNQPNISGTTAAGATSVNIYIDGTKVATIVSSADKIFSWQPGAVLSEGAHQIYAQVGVLSSNKHTITIDTTPPNAPTIKNVAIKKILPANGQIDAMLDIDGEVSADAKFIGLYLNETTLLDTILVSADIWNYQFEKNLAPGEHQIGAKAIDAANNISSPLATKTFTIVVAEETKPEIVEVKPEIIEEPPKVEEKPPVLKEEPVVVVEKPAPVFKLPVVGGEEEAVSSGGETLPAEEIPLELTPSNITELTIEQPPEQPAGIEMAGQRLINLFKPNEQVKTIIKSAAKTAIKIQKTTIDNPAVEKANNAVKKPAIAATAAASVASVAAVGATGVTGASALTYLQFFFTQPLLLFSRRKKSGFGVVYNSVTKQPIDLAVLRVYRADTKQLVRTRVTDKRGRYEFILDPGKYYITVEKKEYKYPSSLLGQTKSDGGFENLYYGNEFEITEKDVMARPIPVDPAKTLKKVKQEMRIYWTRKTQYAVSMVGPALAIVSVAINPEIWVGAVALGQVILYGLFKRLAIKEIGKNFGAVTDAETRVSVARSLVHVFDTKFNKLLDTQIADSRGRYACLVGNQEYYLTVEKPGYYLLRSNIYNLAGKELGYLAEDFAIKPHHLGKEIKQAQLEGRPFTLRTDIGRQFEHEENGIIKAARREGEKFEGKVPEVDLSNMHEEYYRVDTLK